MLLAGVVWLVRLEGKVQTHDLLGTERHETVIKSLDRLDGKMEDLTSYLLRNGYGTDRGEERRPTPSNTHTDRLGDCGGGDD
jgi:hypothetical protein